MPKSTRITISGRNLQFLQELAEQMDEPNLASVMRYLLTDIRGLGYRFGSKPAPRPQTAPIGFDASILETFATPAPIQECDRNYTELDPVIARLSNLIEEF